MLLLYNFISSQMNFVNRQYISMVTQCYDSKVKVMVGLYLSVLSKPHILHAVFSIFKYGTHAYVLLADFLVCAIFRTPPLGGCPIVITLSVCPSVSKNLLWR